MVARKTFRKQLSDIKLHCWIFGRAEVKELRKILNPDEIVNHCAYGYYNGGSGLLVATNERLLLIDKQPLYLNVEEMKYDSIRGVECIQKFLQATISIHTSMKRLRFRSVSDARLKLMNNYISDRIVETQDAIANSFTQDGTIRVKPYLNPAWRPHNSTFLPRRLYRPTKFYKPNKPSTSH